MTGPIAAVVFDLGGVLIDWNPRHLFSKLLPDPEAREAFLAQVCTMEWHVRHDAGVSFADNRRDLTARFPEHADLIAAWDLRWPEMFGGTVPGTPALLEHLAAAGTPLHAITNWPGEKFPLARQMFPFLNLFGTIIVSGDEGIIKPDPEIFYRLLARAGLEAKACLFIDDSIKNVDAARTLGFHAHHFTGADGLRACLAELGLPVPAK